MSKSSESGKTVLYVTQPGACVYQTQGRLRVTFPSPTKSKAGEEVGKAAGPAMPPQEVRLCDLERVVILSGTAGLTSSAATALMEAGIETAFLSSAGRFRGYLAPARGRGVQRRLAQFEAYHNPERRLHLARALVQRKIRNSDVLLSRFARNHADFDPSSEKARLMRAYTACTRAESVESLFGCEGDAAAAYFRAFGRMVGRNGSGFHFAERSKRPPRDPANALLSLGYTLLAAEATSAVAGAGLDPSLGMLHSPQDGRPSLGLDLMEPFRSAVVDRLVLHLTNNRILSPLTDFSLEDTNTGPRLIEPARRRFLTAYEERMTEPFRATKVDMPTTLRERLRNEAHLFARALQDATPFLPFALP